MFDTFLKIIFVSSVFNYLLKKRDILLAKIVSNICLNFFMYIAVSRHVVHRKLAVSIGLILASYQSCM